MAYTDSGKNISAVKLIELINEAVAAGGTTLAVNQVNNLSVFNAEDEWIGYIDIGPETCECDIVPPLGD